MIWLLRPFIVTMTILFGSVVMALLLDVKPKSLAVSKRSFFFASYGVFFTVNITFALIFGMETYGKYYVLLSHLPTFLIFWITTKKRPTRILFALFTAVVLIFPCNMILTAVGYGLKSFFPYSVYIAYIALFPLTMFPICNYFKPGFNYMLNHYNGNRFWMFFILPLLYNVFNYLLGKYNFSSSMSFDIIPFRIMLFLITLSAYILLLHIFKSTREKQILQNEQNILHLQLETAIQNVNELKRTQEQAQLYRHDMRHHISLVNACLAEEDTQKAKRYLANVLERLDEITSSGFCENETVDLILGSFASRAKKEGITFTAEAEIPALLPVGDTEICAVLSNALENAIAACAPVEDGRKKTVRLVCRMSENKLLILIQNPYTGEVLFENGLPQSKREGHGFGITSIVSIVEKYGGMHSFEAKDGVFTLRLVI